MKSKQKNTENFLGTDAPFKLVLKLAIPSMLAQFVNVLYSIVDRIYIGHMPEVGTLALAGVGVCGPIVTLLSSFGTWVGLGGAPAMSIKMGEKDLKGARRILSNGAMMLAVLSVSLTAALFAFKEPLLRLFGAGGNSAPYASEYLTWYAAGTVFAVLTTGLNAYIVGQGHGKAGMLTVCIGAVANIALDPLFIYGFHMGVAGAAIATVISQALSALFTVLFLVGKSAEVRLSFGGYDKKIVGRILLLGLSPFLIIATDSAMILALNGVLRSYGANARTILSPPPPSCSPSCRSSPCPSAAFREARNPRFRTITERTAPTGSKSAKRGFWDCVSSTPSSCSSSPASRRERW